MIRLTKMLRRCLNALRKSRTTRAPFEQQSCHGESGGRNDETCTLCVETSALSFSLFRRRRSQTRAPQAYLGVAFCFWDPELQLRVG